MSDKKRFCPGCGQELPPKVKQCPGCGQKQKNPIYKKWWFWTVIVLVIAAIGASAGGSSSKQKEDTPAPPADVATPQVSVEEPSQPVSEPAPEPEPETEPSNIFRPGDVIDTGTLSITYQECETDWKGYNQYMTPDSGNKVVRAYFIFENTGNRDATCGSFDFDCYADGVSCSTFLWSTEDTLSFTTLSPGRKLQGNVYFEVPADATAVELEYETSFWTQNKVIFVVE